MMQLEHSDIARALNTGSPFIEKIFTECEHCGGEIYEGDDMYELPGSRGMIHADCLSDYFYPYKRIAGEDN